MKKNPKLAAIAGIGLLTTAGASSRGVHTKNYIQQVIDDRNIPLMTSDRLYNLENCPEAKQLFLQMVDILTSVKENALKIGMTDFFNVVNGDPTLKEQFRTIVKETAIFMAENPGKSQSQLWEEAKQEAMLELKKELATSLQGSPLSQTLPPLNSSPDFTSLETTALAKSQVDVPSCLEKFFFN